MNLAITLLVVVAVASAIGTVLQQNQAYPDYVLKFGPFWFEAFRRLGLYDIYGAGWFVGILAFLILSTSVCLYRQVPGMLREMLRFRATSRPVRCAVSTSTPSGGCRIAASTPRRAR